MLTKFATIFRKLASCEKSISIVGSLVKPRRTASRSCLTLLRMAMLVGRGKQGEEKYAGNNVKRRFLAEEKGADLVQAVGGEVLARWKEREKSTFGLLAINE